MNRCKSDKKYINTEKRRTVQGSQQTYKNLMCNLQKRGMRVEMVEIYKLIVIANVLIISSATITVITVTTTVIYCTITADKGYRT
ncbi:unnamed protein product [Brugia pahangi]|uniref:G_PROTEIN_RECEP_F1_2 domain-containing protein n=1 Tax=Brugia pahangi TaxID=6280 RepID=A0A0N4TNU5_BRUPA|nr:unnamed protein product [Brugia pahangi]